MYNEINSFKQHTKTQEELEKQKEVWIKREDLKDFLSVELNKFINNYLLDGDCAFEGDGVMINSNEFNGKLRSEVASEKQ